MKLVLKFNLLIFFLNMQKYRMNDTIESPCSNTQYPTGHYQVCFLLTWGQKEKAHKQHIMGW